MVGWVLVYHLKNIILEDEEEHEDEYKVKQRLSASYLSSSSSSFSLPIAYYQRPRD
jgi:hypothetical protein